MSRTLDSHLACRNLALLTVALVLLTLPATACSVLDPATAPLGSYENPLKMAFLPSSDAQKVLASGEPIGRMLQSETGLKVKLSVPTSYAAAFDALAAESVDVAWLAPFAYVAAKDRFGSEVILTGLRGGSKTYRGQIIVHADSGITDLGGLRGKRFAFVEPRSASGFLYPSALLTSHNIEPRRFFSETTFAGRHDKVVTAVYNRQVDGGAAVGGSDDGNVVDARVGLRGTLPEVMEKVKPIATTDPIPNHTVSVRRGIAPAVVARIQDGLLKAAQSAEGNQALKDLYRIDGLAVSTDAEYEPVRRTASALNLNLDRELASEENRGSSL